MDLSCSAPSGCPNTSSVAGQPKSNASVEFPEPLLVRLDSVLSLALDVSPTKRKKLWEAKIVTLQGGGRTSALRVWDEVTVALRANGSRPAVRHRSAQRRLTCSFGSPRGESNS